MFATHRKIVQLLLLYCIVVQSCVLCDVGSTLTQSNAKSEISGKTARLAEDDRVLRATDERDRPFKEKIGRNFRGDPSFDSQDIDIFPEEFKIKTAISLVRRYVLFSFKRLVEMVEQTTSSVDRFLGLLNLVEHKLELTDKRPISTESSDHSTTSPIVKQSVSSNNHQNVENHSVPEIYNVSDNSVYEDNPSPRETIHSHRNKRTLRVPKKRNTTTIRPYK